MPCTPQGLKFVRAKEFIKGIIFMAEVIKKGVENIEVE
jgi:hypothetical protein